MDLNDRIAHLSVSSVLNRDVKQYGKKFLIDSNDDTCWNSDQGNHQHISISFDKQTIVKEIHLQFQGGFSCKQLDIIIKNDKQNGETIEKTFYPEDINTLQKFYFENNVTIEKTMILRLINPTDFFGRIILYHMKLYGLIDE